MANVKITELTNLTDPSTTDVMPVVDVDADVTKKVSVGEVVGKITGDVEVATDGTATISELPVSKLQDGAARQLLQTAANGTDVEWTDDVDLPGTLDVTGVTTLDDALNVAGLASLDGGIDVDGAFTVANTSGNVATSGTLGVSGQSTLASAAISDLTENRVVIAGASGELEDSANLTFDGSELGITGTLDVSSDATVGGDLTVTGDLTVEGATTTLETQTVTVEDKNIELGVVDTPSDTTADGGGITLKGATDKTINWVNATDAWTFSEHIELASGKEFYIDGNGVLNATTLGSGVVNSSLTSVGTIATGTWEGDAIDAAYLDATVVTTSDTGTVTSTMILDGTIVDGDINASAAIAGTKIDPDFGSQTVETTGVFSAAGGADATPSIAFTGDLNTGIYSPGADQVAISTNGTGRLFVNASGYIGNTLNPSVPFDLVGRAIFGDLSTRVDENYKLQIQSAGNSELKLQSGASSTSFLAFGTTSDALTTRISVNNTDGDLRFATGNSERLRITSDGKLGLGTSDPETELEVEVANNGGNVAIQVTNQASGAGSSSTTASLNLAPSSFGSSIAQLQAVREGTWGSPTTRRTALSFKTTQDTSVGPVDRLYINPAGLVGIGDTGPSETLTVKGASSVDPFSVSGPSSEFLRVDDSGRLLVGTSSARSVFNNTTHSALFQVEGASASGGATGRFVSQVFGSSNNAGPIHFFARHRSNTVGGIDAVGSGDQLGSLSFQGSDGSEFVPAASVAAEVDGTPGANDMPGRLVFSTTADGASSPTEQMRISSDGIFYAGINVGSLNTTNFGTRIGALSNGTLAPGGFVSFKDDDGSGTVANIGGNAGQMRIYGDGDLENTNNSYTGISDIKLKENIVDANSQWDDLKAFQVRNYNFKPETGYNTHTQLGLIAQEVELVSPGLVGESIDEETGEPTKSVNYSVLYMKAVKALQEAMERIEVLEQRLADAGIA